MTVLVATGGRVSVRASRAVLLLCVLPLVRLGPAATPRATPQRALHYAALADACSDVSSPATERPPTIGGAPAGVPFRLNFGKHRGKLICEISSEYAQVWRGQAAPPSPIRVLSMRVPINAFISVHPSLAVDGPKRHPHNSARPPSRARCAWPSAGVALRPSESPSWMPLPAVTARPFPRTSRWLQPVLSQGRQGGRARPCSAWGSRGGTWQRR